MGKITKIAHRSNNVSSFYLAEPLFGAFADVQMLSYVSKLIDKSDLRIVYSLEFLFPL